VLDLGADEFTVGRAHPMLDAALRVEEIERAAKEPDSAVLLVDVVLGHGAAPDPAGDIAPALEAAQRGRRGLAVVASVIGTAADPQALAAQTARLEAAGAWVLPSNAQAARAAACIAGEARVAEALLAGGSA
jgi:FdrA protein